MWGTVHVAAGIHRVPVVKSCWPLSRTSVIVAAVAATHEECVKLTIVLLIAYALPSQLNDSMDGIIYRSIAGVGMAVSELVFYMTLSDPQGFLLPSSEVIRLVCHRMMGNMCGFAIGMKRMQMRVAAKTSGTGPSGNLYP